MTMQYSSIVCSFIRPFSPGYSGGEIRDYHIIQHLSSISSIKFISMTDSQPNGRQDDFASILDEYYEPAILRSHYPQFINRLSLRRSWFTRFFGLLRMFNVPVWGLKYHRDISLVSWQIDAYVLPIFKFKLMRESPDFIFISPQLNPTLLRLDTTNLLQTRTILLTYDIEAVRLARIAEAETGLARVAKRIESHRAERFERENINRYDGFVVVSDLDKKSMVERYGLESERVLTVENSIDVNYFSYSPNIIDTDKPNIVFIGNLAYWPNHDAAIRLLRDIMPRIRYHFPGARAWIVGDRPKSELEAFAYFDLDIITGPVDDVRPYLQKASVVCVPLRAGSGTKYKILEALGVGRPLVCTTIAAEGLDLHAGTHFVLANSDDEIADACIQILKRPASFQEMVSEARTHVERFYSWESNLKKLDVWLSMIRERPKVRS